MENWKPWQSNKFYLVSDLGNVKELARPIFNRGRSYTKPQKTIKPFMDPCGYLFVVLRKTLNTGSERIFVHRLVMEVFVGDCPPYKTVDHINRIRSDNSLKNLRYATKSEQDENRDLSGISGENSKFSKLKLTDVIKIREMIADDIKIKDIAKKYRVGVSTISNISKGKSWK